MGSPHGGAAPRLLPGPEGMEGGGGWGGGLRVNRTHLEFLKLEFRLRWLYSGEEGCREEPSDVGFAMTLRSCLGKDSA